MEMGRSGGCWRKSRVPNREASCTLGPWVCTINLHLTPHLVRTQVFQTRPGQTDARLERDAALVVHSGTSVPRNRSSLECLLIAFSRLFNQCSTCSRCSVRATICPKDEILATYFTGRRIARVFVLLELDGFLVSRVGDDSTGYRCAWNQVCGHGVPNLCDRWNFFRS
jgi:hypothetical protein